MNARLLSLQVIVCIFIALFAAACSPSSESAQDIQEAQTEQRLDLLEAKLRAKATNTAPKLPADSVRIGDQDHEEPAAKSALKPTPTPSEPQLEAIPFDDTEPPKDRPRRLALESPDPSRDIEPRGIEETKSDLPSDLRIVDHAIATHVAQRSPQGAAEHFDLFGEKKTLWAWVKVANKGEDASTLTMVWTHKGKERSRIDLNVGVSKGWRTWSKKTVSPKDAGLWTVEVYNPEGDRLSTINFNVTSSTPATTSGVDFNLEEPGC